VGNSQMIRCIASTVSGVESSSVMISWMGPGGDIISNNSRLTVSQIAQNGANLESSLNFEYLMEGDEGMYTCTVAILGMNESMSIMLGALTGNYKLLHVPTSTVDP